MNMPSRNSLVLAAALCALACSSLAQAQSVYRIVGPDGKVTFSDRAPSEDAEPALTANQSAAPSGTSTLPYSLRQVASRFPVTLYTGADCAPCVSARNLLTGRGVPFNERTVSSNEDITELGRLGGGSSLPFGTIGGQHLTGFSDSEWTQYLDAAGYPKKSELQLPPTGGDTTGGSQTGGTETSSASPRSRCTTPRTGTYWPRTKQPGGDSFLR